MTEIIKLPHFRISGSHVLFLNSYLYCDFFVNIEIENTFHKRVLLKEGILIKKRKIERGRSNENLLVLEPHPDDLALSCSGYILDKIRRGANIKVLNLFTKSHLSTFPWKDIISISEEEYESLRLEESSIAIEQYLKLAFESLQFPLALKRGHKTPFENITNDDRDIENFLYKLITGEIERQDYSTILAPLTIGNHIDHIITFNVAKRIKYENKGLDLVLYEDMPYARNHIAYSQKMHELKTQLNFEAMYVPVTDFVDIMADLASIYRSQFDDLNRSQMLAVIKENARRITSEGRSSGKVLSEEFYQRVFEVRS